jgi:hypothetical protein
MRGQVLEIAPSDTAKAVQVLRAVQESGRLPLEEVAMYGSLVHVVAPAMAQHQEAIAAELVQAGVEPGHMAIIEPSLEDVFIACMR